MAIPSEGLKMRACTRCGEQKAEADFYVRKTPHYGSTLHRECKSCAKARTHTRYHSDKHEQLKAENRAYGSKRRRQFKEAVFAFYGGYVCACCGETNQWFLTLDHIHNDGAEFRRANWGTQRKGGGVLTYEWLVKHGFPSGYQVLCANCQYGKRMNHGVCPHQTTCNDQPQGVGSSDPKHSAPVIRLVTGEDMISSASESRSSRKADAA